MAFKLVAIFAALACVSASYVPAGLQLPHSGIIPTTLAYGGSPLVTGYAHQPQIIVQNAHPELLQQAPAPLIGNYINPHVVPAAGVVPEGKTTLTKTFVSTPTYVTSHVSERVHSNEQPIYNGYGYGKNVISNVPALSYAAPVQHGSNYGY